MIKHIIIFAFLFFAVSHSLRAQCSCYSVEGLHIVGQDSMLLQLSNNCDNNVYLNLYVISTVSPYDTLGKQELWNAAIFPFDSIVDNILTTTLSTVPTLGTYRVSITNGTLNCDSLELSPTLSVYQNDYEKDVKVFPNPNNGYFSIDLSYDFKSATISILDITGRILQSRKVEESQTLNLQIEEQAGVYFLMIESGSKSAVAKLIKE